MITRENKQTSNEVHTLCLDHVREISNFGEHAIIYYDKVVTEEEDNIRLEDRKSGGYNSKCKMCASAQTHFFLMADCNG